MFGDSIHLQSEHRILCNPSLHPQHPCRHFVVGVFLDPRRGLASSRLAGSTDRTYYDHDERWSSCVTA